MNFWKKIKTKRKDGYFSELYQEAKWIFLYIRRYWASVAFYIVMGIVGTLAGFVGSIASKHLIDAVTGYEAGKIGMIIAVMTGMVLGNVVTKAFVSRVSAHIKVEVQNEIRAEMFDKILYTDWEELSKYQTGDLLNRLNGDVGIVSNSVISWIPEFVTKSVQFLGSFAIILYYDVAMALIAMFSAPVTILISGYLLGKMRAYNKEMREISSEMMSFQNDAFHSLQTLKSFNLMETFSERMKKMQHLYRERMLDYNRFSIYISSFMSVVGAAVSYICFGWGVYRLWSGAITYGTMTLFLQMASSVSASFSALVRMIPTAVAALTSAGRLMEVSELEKEELLDERELSYIRDHREKGVTVEASHVQMIYKDGTLVFSDGNFIAKPGEITAVIGASGEGKTTLIRLLLGLLIPAKGTLTVRTDEMQRCRVSSGTRDFFSYVPQGNTMFTGSVAENLRIVKPDATEDEMQNALKIGEAYEFVMQHPDGLEQKIGENGSGISEGQAQRIAIARAVLKDASVLLLDEATSALDIGIERQVLSNLAKSIGDKTCIVVTHRPSVLSMCAHIYEMEGDCLKKIK